MWRFSVFSMRIPALDSFANQSVRLRGNRSVLFIETKLPYWATDESHREDRTGRTPDDVFQIPETNIAHV